MHVDIVLPTLDPKLERFRAALQSISEQTYSDISIIIVDDSTEVEVTSVASNFDDTEVINGPGTTLAEALNKGINYADGPLVARQDCDDISHRKRIETQVEEFISDSTLDILGTGGYVNGMNENNVRRHVIENPEMKDFKEKNPIIHGSVMFRQDSIISIGGYDNQFYTSEDIELWIRAIENDLKIRNIDEPLYQFNLRNDSVYGSQLRETKLMATLAWKMHNNERGKDMDVTEDMSVIYEAMSNSERRDFHIGMAMGLLRYGKKEKARKEVREALKYDPTAIVALGLIFLSHFGFLTTLGIKLFRKLKNEKIEWINSSYL